MILAIRTDKDNTEKVRLYKENMEKVLGDYHFVKSPIYGKITQFDSSNYIYLVMDIKTFLPNYYGLAAIVSYIIIYLFTQSYISWWNILPGVFLFISLLMTKFVWSILLGIGAKNKLGTMQIVKDEELITFLCDTYGAV